MHDLSMMIFIIELVSKIVYIDEIREVLYEILITHSTLQIKLALSLFLSFISKPIFLSGSLWRG